MVRGRGRGGAVERLSGGESPLGNVWKGGDTWASWTFFWRRPRYHCQESGMLECWKTDNSGSLKFWKSEILNDRRG